MSNSVAVGLDDDSFFTAHQRLEQELGSTGKNRVPIMSDAGAVGMDTDSFFMALQRMELKLGIM